MSKVRSRRAAREAAFQAVYQCASGGSSITTAIEEALDRQEFTEEAAELVRELAAGAVTHVTDLDARYAPFLKAGWTPDRLAMIDRLLLRLAVFELWSMPSVPPKVTITEAINLAKRFGGVESGPFINGVLGKVLDVSPKKEWVPGEDTAQSTQENPVEPEPIQVNLDGPEHAWTIKSED